MMTKRNLNRLVLSSYERTILGLSLKNTEKKSTINVPINKNV